MEYVTHRAKPYSNFPNLATTNYSLNDLDDSVLARIIAFMGDDESHFKRGLRGTCRRMHTLVREARKFSPRKLKSWAMHRGLVELARYARECSALSCDRIGLPDEARRIRGKRILALWEESIRNKMGPLNDARDEFDIRIVLCDYRSSFNLCDVEYIARFADPGKIMDVVREILAPFSMDMAPIARERTVRDYDMKKKIVHRVICGALKERRDYLVLLLLREWYAKVDHDISQFLFSMLHHGCIETFREMRQYIGEEKVLDGRHRAFHSGSRELCEIVYMRDGSCNIGDDDLSSMVRFAVRSGRVEMCDFVMMLCDRSRGGVSIDGYAFEYSGKESLRLTANYMLALAIQCDDVVICRHAIMKYGARVEKRVMRIGLITRDNFRALDCAFATSYERYGAGIGILDWKSIDLHTIGSRAVVDKWREKSEEWEREELARLRAQPILARIARGIREFFAK